MSDETHQPTSRSKRFFKLAGMTASVAGKFASSRIKGAFQSEEDRQATRDESNVATGELIAKTLGELKGAAMKLGQMASVAQDILPKEIADALTVLQKEAPPMPFEAIRDQIESELGSIPELLFDSFDETPFAAASIGQVHRAVTDDGREVVVKVQYPGVDRSVDSDMAHLKLALRASGLIRVNKRSIDALFKEIKERLHEELDYTNEAENVRRFGAFHKDDPFVVVPKVVGERSAQRVLTLTYEPGTHLSKLDEEGFTQETRDLIGKHLFELTCQQIFQFRSIHADPNPANFAFRKDGTVVLYDFGCVKDMKHEILASYKQTLLSAINEDYAGVETGLLALGARTPDGPPIELDYYKDWRDVILLPFVSGEPFDYGTAKIHDEVVKRIPGILKRQRSFQPPHELAFVDRVIGGHYGTLRLVRARGHFLQVVLDSLALPQLGDEGYIA